MRSDELEPVFVEFIPSDLKEGYLYLALAYATASHLCVCGCGQRVVTPFGPADWVLAFDGKVTLSPSVGNGQFACGSHYVIQNNQVVWCRPMTQAAAQAVQMLDATRRAQTYGGAPRGSAWTRLARWLRQPLRRP